MDLVIVESPTKARTLGRFLPDKDYQVVATVGHVRDLPKSKLGVDVDHDFKPDWVMVKGKREVMKKLRDAGLKAKKLLLATDPDREGEAIAWHVYELLKEDRKFPVSKKQVLRISFHEITKEAILEALDHAGKINTDLFDAQQARRVVDRLVGYKLSPVLWRKIRRGLSAGRVQSVAVRLVVEREREREKFKPEEYWELVAELQPIVKDKASSAGAFMSWLKTIGEKKAEVKDEKQAMEVLGDLDGADYKVKGVEKKEVKRNPAPPFTTSTLQQTAGNKLGWSARHTMRVAQSLYEKGLITYHRTDSLNLAEQAVKKVRDYIKKEYGDKYLSVDVRRYKTKAKVAQEAHEAIRPTSTNQKSEAKNKSLKSDEERLYRMIWQRFVACQMAAAVYDQTKINIEARSKLRDAKELVYGLVTEGKVRKFAGWLKVYGRGARDDEVPELKENDPLQLIEATGGQLFTEPPARYSEASLIKKLEELGIGRPSTYATIMSTIQARGYVERTDGRLMPTAVGMATNDFLVKNFPQELDYAFTAKMEDDLDEIANGDKKWVPVVSDFYKPFSKTVEKAEAGKRVAVPTEKTGKKCPECKEGEVVIRTGRFGKFLSCSRFPDCKYTARYLDKIDMKCPECGKKEGGEVVVKRTRKGRTFYGCSRYPDCKWASWTDPRKGRESKSDE